jgi:hypothetical protein
MGIEKKYYKKLEYWDTVEREKNKDIPYAFNEEIHENADALLVEFVRELGYTKLADYYDKLSEKFWYA